MLLDVQPARFSDASIIARLVQLTWLATYPGLLPDVTADDIPPWKQATAEQVQRWQCDVQDASVRVLIARTEDGEPIAFCKATQNPREISSIYVLPEYRSNGVGTRLMTIAWKWLGDGTVSLWVARVNTRAQHFYVRQGFALSGEERRIDYPSGKGVDLVEMKSIF